MAGHITALVAARTLLTYLVPFSVSTCSALQINKLARNARMPDTLCQLTWAAVARDSKQR